MSSGDAAVAEMLRAHLLAFLHENGMVAYLAIMAVRLLELPTPLATFPSRCW